MRITEATRFPHPVLSQETGDFLSGEFGVAFTAVETPQTGALSLDHEITLTEPAIRDLVLRGEASVGCFVRCNDTYYTELLRLSWPSGRSDFTPGSLLNRVTLRPLIWLEKPLESWDPGTIHVEFEPPVSLACGDVVAVGPERIMSIGQAKLAPLESVFELRKSSLVAEGQISIDPEGDRIGIVVAPSTFEAITLLRGQSRGQPVVMNAVYLPAIMEVLDLLRAGPDQYADYRWKIPFIAKCDARGIELAQGMSILETAQALLDSPARALAQLVSDGET